MADAPPAEAAAAAPVVDAAPAAAAPEIQAAPAAAPVDTAPATAAADAAPSAAAPEEPKAAVPPAADGTAAASVPAAEAPAAPADAEKPAEQADAPAPEVAPAAEAQEAPAAPQEEQRPATPPPVAVKVLSQEQEQRFLQEKAYLMKAVDKQGSNLYDHLSMLLSQLLEERPVNLLDALDVKSSENRRNAFKVDFTSISANTPAATQEADAEPLIVSIAKTQDKLFEASPEFDAKGNPVPPPEEGETEFPDMIYLSHLFKWAGVTIGEEDTFKLMISIRKLAATRPIHSIRLFGKILGTKKNYIILESVIKTGETLPEDDAAAAAKEAAAAADAAQEEEKKAQEAAPQEGAEGAAADVDDLASLPKPVIKKTGPLPKEERTGINKLVYWASTYPGDEWTRLPDAVPELIQSSRKIRKYFTGDLKAKIVSYPPFQGTEADYLRCQIARIAASTIVSPAGYYTREEGDDEESGAANIMLNAEHEELPNEQLLDMANWVHHVPYILPQGRTTWAPLPKPPKEPKEGEDEEEEKEDEEEEDDSKKEEGPAILSPLSEDAEHNGSPAWTGKLASPFSTSMFAPVVLRSNRWPGAVAVSYNDKYNNIYIGSGHKEEVGYRYAAPALPDIQPEYKVKEEGGIPITEDREPTLEEEKEEERKKKEAEEEEKADAEGDGEAAEGAEEGEEGEEKE